MSYSRHVDEYHDGLLTELREKLISAVRLFSGNKEFDIFQDRSHILTGQAWQRSIDQSIAQADVFLPIVTPGYFSSEPCQDEFRAFLRREAELGRNDLIFPVYFVDCPELEGGRSGTRRHKIADVIKARNFCDWRKLRNQAASKSRAARQAVTSQIEVLAGHICQAFRDSPKRSPRGRGPVSAGPSRTAAVTRPARPRAPRPGAKMVNEVEQYLAVMQAFNQQAEAHYLEARKTYQQLLMDRARRGLSVDGGRTEAEQILASEERVRRRLADEIARIRKLSAELEADQPSR